MPAIPPHATPVSDAPWDGPATVAEIPNTEGADVFRRMYAWVDPAADPDTKAAYKFPHHEWTDGSVGAAVMAGCSAGMGRIGQADIPSADDAGVQAHLQAHMDAMQGRSEELPASEVRFLDVGDLPVQVRSEAKRELDIRIVPWDTVISHELGAEMFARGAFTSVDPEKVLLKAPDTEGNHRGPVTGRGIAAEERADGQYMTFRVSRTQAGDEQIALAADGVVRGASIGFYEVPGGTTAQRVEGRRVMVHGRVGLDHVITTWRPAYQQAAVVAMRSEQKESPVPTETAPEVAAVAAPAVDFAPLIAEMQAGRSEQATAFATMAERIGRVEEQTRANFTIPSAGPQAELSVRAQRGEWMSAVLRMLSGERVNDLQMRSLADLITGDNVGVVPDAFSTELIGVIDPSRAFLNSTRKLDLPNAGMSLVVPKIVTRPTAGVQARYGDESAPEKTDITSTATAITNVTFDAVTIAGGGDISLQLLKRSSPSYLSLFLELLAEAYGQNAETEALATLIDTVGDVGGVNDGGTLDPENLILGPAWISSATVKKPLTTMWLSSAAAGAFIDAKANTTNQPLYSNIQAGFTAGGGAQGTISGLRPVYVPALDATAIDVLVGPSSGFGWTEDGSYTLQVDVPAKAGRDVALVGILWFAPMYPTAFTAYAISGS